MQDQSDKSDVEHEHHIKGSHPTPLTNCDNYVHLLCVIQYLLHSAQKCCLVIFTWVVADIEDLRDRSTMLANILRSPKGELWRDCSDLGDKGSALSIPLERGALVARAP